MNGTQEDGQAPEGEHETVRPLSPAAQRALAEAQVRRRERDALPPLPPEVNGRDGPDPVRYGDWEKKGLAVDF